MACMRIKRRIGAGIGKAGGEEELRYVRQGQPGKMIDKALLLFPQRTVLPS